MPPSEHAVLSPSSAERWLSCPASVRVGEKLPKQSDSPYAAEGTLAHALAEIELSFALGKITTRQYNGRMRAWLAESKIIGDDLLDMKGHVRTYTDLVLERVALFPNSAILLEQRVPTGVPTCWGTSDTVIVSPIHVEIIDLKYGVGVPVSSLGNPQLRLYGVGALEAYGDLLGEAQVVRLTICQPRLDSVSTEELTAEDLRAWRDSILPIAKEALGDNARFGPSETACRWCPAAGVCRARVEKLTQEDFGSNPDLVTNEELAALLEQLPEIRQWVDAIEVAALNKAYSLGEHLPGWKVVMSGGIRVVRRTTEAIEALESAGFERSDVVKPESLKGIGDLEKLIKSRTLGLKKDATLESVIGHELVEKTPGKPAMAHEDDRRPAVNPDTEARKEFSS